MIAYKFLRAGRVAPFSRVAWPAPMSDAPAAWLQAVSGERACEGRVHACRVEDLPEWLDAELWRVELDGDELAAGRLRERLEHCASMAELEAAASTPQPPGREERALGYVLDAARHAVAAFSEPADAPRRAAVNAFIAAHAAAFAAGDTAAAPRERTALAAWLAQRLELPPAAIRPPVLQGNA